MTPILAVIFVAPLVIGITVLIYMFYYRRKINKRLAKGNISGKREGRPMMPPIVFILVTMICVSIVTTLLVIVFAIFVGKNIVSTGRSHGGFDGESLIHIRTISEDDMDDSFFEGYKTGDDIAGYEKFTETNGDITFYYYKVKDNMLGIMPRLIIATETSKDTADLEYGFHVYAREGKRKLDLGGGGKCYMYAIDCNNFEGTIKLEEFCFDEELLFEHLSWDETYESAQIKGTLELDMSYPGPGY
ncbi:hypothetical protein [Ruminococcus sp.]|uniref:hypothetical protein n=1 Tax=Ruminococcus sp. TaxID=41978 RepID=UPI00258EE841|nr:hypothetical protein [Ruminococcus sp.]MCR5021605.1 hypothetical protein [Ruminococcus sp.]